MNNFEQQFKKTIEFVNNSGMESPNKPAIPHALRVGKLLYEKGFSDDVVNAGLLHDMLEWSDMSEDELRKMFGDYVVNLIQANTKDRSITDKKQRRQAQIEKDLAIGDDALAIKIADNLDSFYYYSQTGNEGQLERCRDWNILLKRYMSDSLLHIFVLDISRIQ